MEMEKEIEAFYTLVAPSRPNEWELEEVLGGLHSLSTSERNRLLEQVPAIWPVSHSLCFSFLTRGAEVLYRLPGPLLLQWVQKILHRYETEGLRGARSFMDDLDANFLLPMEENSTVRFESLRGRMATFLRGISGEHLEIETGSQTATDTRTIYIPESLSLLNKASEHVLLYKLLLSLQWGFITIGTFRAEPDEEILSLVHGLNTAGHEIAGSQENIEQFLISFPIADLAQDIFMLVEFRRVVAFIAQALPGLWRATAELRSQIVRLRSKRCYISVKSRLVEELFLDILEETEVKIQGVPPLHQCTRKKRFPQESFKDLWERYTHIVEQEGDYRKHDFMPLLGVLPLADAKRKIEERRLEQKAAFVNLLADFLMEQGEGGRDHEGKNDISERLDPRFVVMEGSGDDERKVTLIIDNEKQKMSEELLQLASQVMDDVGQVPNSYVAAAMGIAGQGRSKSEEPQEVIESLEVPHMDTEMFDEWDYRRSGYREKWCHVYVKELSLIRSNFVGRTLDKYQGERLKLRRQFEMMRSHERFVRRQREGVDVDLDGVVDSLGDMKAGLPPSERVFVRLLRDERDIAAFFLVDMSNSTEGWVGTVIKEALVLLCEAMEAVGDRYGIYGFSGMRRSRCEVYHIKHLHEMYGQKVHERIGSVMPKEYTRMGPPIRYLTRLFATVEAKARLLFILSDGKPEDYDDYKGEYAIEDTKKALVEARGAGIHPFCITVDRHAQDYLEYMFGRGRYCFVKNLEMLPSRMTEVYRNLTR